MRNTVTSMWMLLLFAFPLIFYILFRLFEVELTHFIIPLFPDEPDKSFGFYNDFLRLCFHEMLWWDVFALVSWAFFLYVPLKSMTDRMERTLTRRLHCYVTLTLALSLTLTLMISSHTLNTFPNSADEYVYLYQAENLSQGRLVQTPHPLEEFFHFSHIAQKDGKRVGRFPPGWPVLLSLPFVLEVPAFWLNPVLGIIALWVFYRFAKRYYGRTVALWSLIALAFTGYYIFNSASFFSHTPCLLFTIAFVYALHLYQEKKFGGYALLAGVFLGLIVITRYYTAVLLFIPVLASLAYQYHWKAVRPLILIGLGCAPFFAFLFWYNYKITGNPFLPVTVWADPEETIGFVKGHTFVKGIEHFVRRIVLFLYWCSPALLIFYPIFLYQKIRDKTQRFIRPEDYFIVFLFVGYFFYHHIGGNQYGPRFVFEALPFVVVFIVEKVYKNKDRWALALMYTGIIYALVKLPFIAQRERQVVTERMDVYTQVAEAGITNAVILVATHTGVIRPMPIRDLTRNFDYRQDIIFAEDQRGMNYQLMNFYPNRSFYKYVRTSPEKVEGELVRVR